MHKGIFKMMTNDPKILNGLKEFDTATVFNAVEELIKSTEAGSAPDGTGIHPLNYTGPEIISLNPELGNAIGTVVTAEVTTNDPDSEKINWDEYYDTLDSTPGPIIAVIKDVDSRPGRGASFGDGMARRHRLLGVTGAVIEGTVRDIAGITEVGLPIWAKGKVPGHGVFNLISVNRPVTAGQLIIYPGEIIIADMDGCTKIPMWADPKEVLQKAKEVRQMEQEIFEVIERPGMTYEKLKGLS